MNQRNILILIALIVLIGSIMVDAQFGEEDGVSMFRRGYGRRFGRRFLRRGFHNLRRFGRRWFRFG
ncbi:hypothetical protein RDWZM_002028 [Blomia tropicalis]|uniref:Uncharacterized protein n=1 Tax=Blomia tropicalis TaxID=40697 RepID=A0A9Q0ME65_BLOTA|nr:hypothetical protein BLOT_002384 [Blomia tropicalis]KAJ6223483.1 hypothetical protein RDWZM_002028 [Blomia tropicalis]